MLRGVVWCRGYLVDEFEPLEVVFGPAGLVLDHALERLPLECATCPVRGYRNAAAVGMSIALVRSNLANKIKTVTGKSCDEFAGRNRAEGALVNVHALDGNGNTGLILRHFFDLNGIAGSFG